MLIPSAIALRVDGLTNSRSLPAPLHDAQPFGTMPSQANTLLLLPDELLAYIFDVIVEDRDDCNKTLTSVALVCRRLYSAVQPVLYRKITVVDADGSIERLRAALKQKPSLGQLVLDLSVLFASNISSWLSGADEDDNKSTEDLMNEYAPLCGTLYELKTLHLYNVSPPAWAAILSSLPEPTLCVLKINARVRFQDQAQLLQIWARLQAFNKLYTLTLKASSLHLTSDPTRKFLPVDQIRVPQLLMVDTTDWFCVALFGADARLNPILPNLMELFLSTTGFVSKPVVARLLSNLPPALNRLKLEDETFKVRSSPKYTEEEALTGYLSSLPPIRHLSLYPTTFRQSDLITFLPHSHLESIEFAFGATVTDRLLEVLVGSERPPSLRAIQLDHMATPSMEQISEVFGDDGPVSLIDWAQLRNSLRPHWQPGCSEEGFLSALATAKANGIEITGTAVDCLEWEETESLVRAFYMMRRARATDNYDEVVELYGEEMVTV